MKKSLFVLMFVILMCPLLVQAYSYQDLLTFLGATTANPAYEIVGGALDNSIESLLKVAGGTDVQPNRDKEIFELRKESLLQDADDNWSIIKATFILISEIIILIIMLLEMRLILYVFVELLPSIFIKIRNSLVRWVQRV